VEKCDRMVPCILREFRDLKKQSVVMFAFCILPLEFSNKVKLLSHLCHNHISPKQASSPRQYA